MKLVLFIITLLVLVLGLANATEKCTEDQVLQDFETEFVNGLHRFKAFLQATNDIEEQKFEEAVRDFINFIGTIEFYIRPPFLFLPNVKVVKYELVKMYREVYNSDLFDNLETLDDWGK